MKLRNLFLSMLFCATAASAQDVITKTDGSKLEAKVEEITESVVRYRKASNPNGPVYTIPLTSIVTIVYENGSVDNFNATSASQTEPSDDELKRYAEVQNIATASAMNDSQLLKLADPSMTAEKLRKKAKLNRIIGWAGGVFLVAAGIVAYNIMADGGNYHFGTQVAIAGGVIGVGWCVGLNLRANYLIRRAKDMEMYSSAIIENEMYRFGDKSLTAGVNVMGNRMTRTQGIGLSLSLNF